MTKTPLIIFGAGGFAREAYSWLPAEYQVEAFFTDEAIWGQSLFGIPLISSLQGMSGASFLLGVGCPQTKEKMHHMAIQAGLRPSAPIIHPTAVIGRMCHLSPGVMLCPQSVITTNVVLETGVMLNLGATVGHDTTIDQFSTVSPGANISGNVQIRERVYVGTNAAIREKILIDSDSMIGMGSVVVKNVPRGTTVVGNPARQK